MAAAECQKHAKKNDKRVYQPTYADTALTGVVETAIEISAPDAEPQSMCS